jgi:hypothetical protein
LYTPPADFEGLDSFGYVVTDGELTGAGTVSITVGPVNDPPVAFDDLYVTDDDSVLQISGIGVLANDTDIETNPEDLTAIETSNSADFVLYANGNFEFTPQDQVFGTFVFTYKANDGQNDSNEALITITVEEKDPPPG